jgi:hypothetical protein
VYIDIKMIGMCVISDSLLMSSPNARFFSMCCSLFLFENSERTNNDCFVVLNVCVGHTFTCWCANVSGAVVRVRAGVDLDNSARSDASICSTHPTAKLFRMSNDG